MPPNAFRYVLPFLTCYVMAEGYYIKSLRSKDLNRITNTLLDYISKDKLLADKLLYAKENLKPRISVYTPVSDTREIVPFPSDDFAKDFQEVDDFAEDFQQNDDYAKDFQESTGFAKDFQESDDFSSDLEDRDNYDSDFYNRLMSKLVTTVPGQDEHRNINVNLVRKRGMCDKVLIGGPLMKSVCV